MVKCEMRKSLIATIRYPMWKKYLYSWCKFVFKSHCQLRHEKEEN